MNCQSATGTHSSITHHHTRRTRNKNRNSKPCGNCSDSQVRCNVSPPYSTHLCQRCEKAGLNECPPHVPRVNGRRRERRAAPYSWRQSTTSPVGPNDYSIYAHQNNYFVGRSGELQFTADNAQNSSNAISVAGLVPTEPPSYSGFTPSISGRPIYGGRISSYNDGELRANNTSTSIFGLYTSNSNAVNQYAAQIVQHPAMPQPGCGRIGSAL